MARLTAIEWHWLWKKNSDPEAKQTANLASIQLTKILKMKQINLQSLWIPQYSKTWKVTPLISFQIKL